MKKPIALPNADDISNWRLRARACREVAVEFIFPSSQTRMRELADEYDDLAARVSRALAVIAECAAEAARS